MNQKIIVVDNQTNGIMCECATYSVAHSVSSGFINSCIKVLPSNLPWQREEFNLKFNDINQHYQISMGKINDMNPSLINDEWINLKNLAMLRNIWQLLWETRCNQYLLNRNIEYAHIDQFEGFLWRELDACKPELEFYTPAIIEWASLSDVNPRTAYQELKLKAESRGLQYIRNYAIHQKYVFLLNQENTKEGLLEVLLEGMSYLINRAGL
jgi:hypothetical protein